MFIFLCHCEVLVEQLEL